MKRSQAALEFLMTYGWAILITMTAVGVLVYLGVSDQSAATPAKCTFGNGVVCLGSQLTKTQAIIVLRNSNTGPMYELSANITNSNIACTVNPSGAVAQDQKFNITCNTASLNFQKNGQLKLDLHFKKMPGGFDIISNGDVYNRVQS